MIGEAERRARFLLSSFLLKAEEPQSQLESTARDGTDFVLRPAHNRQQMA